MFKKSIEKIRFSLKSDRNNGYFTITPMSFLTISHSVLLRMRNVSDESCGEIPSLKNKHFLVKLLFFENSAIYEIMLKNIIEPGRPQMAIRRMRFSC
jgi:hypothetical protein